ncbi:MAG: hypothetical protein V4590_05660 [Bacteroidota bacterium]
MKKHHFFPILVSAVLFTSCSPKYYSANTQNVPLISAKGESNLTFAGNSDQLNFQGAYGVTNGFAIKADVGFFNPQNHDNGDGGSGKFFEVGGGYFTPLAGNFVLEVYGIAGMGSMENHFPSSVEANPQTTGKITADLFRYGVQPNFGYKSKYFSAAISSRLVGLNYASIEGDLIYDGEDQVAYLNNNSSHFLIEPAITLKAGIDKVKLQVQLGNSFNVSNPDFRQDKGFLTMGLNFKF